MKTFIEKLYLEFPWSATHRCPIFEKKNKQRPISFWPIFQTLNTIGPVYSHCGLSIYYSRHYIRCHMYKRSLWTLLTKHNIIVTLHDCTLQNINLNEPAFVHMVHDIHIIHFWYIFQKFKVKIFLWNIC